MIQIDRICVAKRTITTVVLFYKPGQLPTHICIADITSPLTRRIPGYITGLSGAHSLRSLMFARQYANAKKMELLLIDMAVRFEQLNYRRLVTSESVKEHDVLNVLRLSKELTAVIAGYWKEWVIEDEGIAAQLHYDWQKPIDFVTRRPDFIPRLLQQSEFAHINLVVHPVNMVFHKESLIATSFRVGYPHIEGARARFRPEIEVKLK